MSRNCEVKVTDCSNVHPIETAIKEVRRHRRSREVLGRLERTYEAYKTNDLREKIDEALHESQIKFAGVLRDTVGAMEPDFLCRILHV